MTTTTYKPKSFGGEGSIIDQYFAPQPEQTDTRQNWELFKKSNPKHMTILSLCRQAQWTVKHPKYGEVADMKRLAEFLKSEKSPVKKPLNDMSGDELEKIIAAFGGIVTSKFKRKTR